MDNLVWILVAAALVIFVIGRRLAGEPLRAKRVFVLPLLIAIAGAYQMKDLHHVAPIDVAVMVVEAAFALAIGAVRGITIHVFVRDGHLWMRYRPLTLAVWAIAIAVRFGIGALGVAAGANSHVVQTAIVLMLGLTFAAEGAIVGLRGMRLGAPFAPQNRNRGTRTKMSL
jgi:hypothetical protein